MQPQQNTNPQPGQPTNPVQPVNTYDFTQVSPAPQQPQSTPPQQPSFDPNSFKQEVIDGVKDVLQTTLQRPEDQQIDNPQEDNHKPKDQYGNWGELFQDVDKVIEQKLADRDQQVKQTTEQLQQQEQQNQAAIDASLNELRAAGYLPPVQNKFDENDAGKQAENELIGYAVKLGSTNLSEVAQELKSHHDRGEYYDWSNKSWKQVNTPDNSPSMFGSLPVTPDGQPLPPVNPTQAPPQYPPNYGPHNPYMNPYPAGFNAPVSGGGSYTGQGMQGQNPSPHTLRRNSYDQLVDIFNRTQ